MQALRMERKKSLKRSLSLKAFAEERKRDIHQAFRLLDENNDGLINFLELKTMMEKLGFPATDGEVSYILRKLGKQEEFGFQSLAMLHCLGAKARSPSTRSRGMTAPSCPAPAAKPVLEKGVCGCVKWFNVKNGYGFITRHDNGNDVFVHNTAIAANSANTIGKWRWRGLADGEVVYFDVVVGKKGLEAANVTGPNGAPVRGSLFARDRPRHRKNRSDKQRWPVYTSLERASRQQHQENGADSGLPPSSSRHGERRYLSRRRPLLQSSDRSSSESETGTSPSRCSNASNDSSSSGDVGGSGDGLISEEEFFMFMNQFSGEDDLMEELLAAFKVFDKDGNGFISREELKRAMDMIGEEMSEKALDDLLSTVDVNKDGKIDYNEFAKMLL